MKLDLTTLVTQRKLESEPVCPKCGGECAVVGTCTTLLGFTGEVNPNHKWESSICHVCAFRFIVERKGLNVWIVDESNKVLAGLPNCFERYIYTCTHCGGDVVEHCTELDGVTPTHSLHITREGKQWCTFYSCKSCGQQIEVQS